MKFQLFTFIPISLFSFASAAEPIVCTTKGNNTIEVKMTVPHSKEVLVYERAGIGPA